MPSNKKMPGPKKKALPNKKPKMPTLEIRPAIIRKSQTKRQGGAAYFTRENSPRKLLLPGLKSSGSSPTDYKKRAKPGRRKKAV